MLNTYMIFSRYDGQWDGASLVFAHSAKEARVVAWRSGNLFTSEWIDLAVRRLWNKLWLYDEALPDKLANGEAHVIDAPVSCGVCEFWGHSPIGDDGLCEGCRERIARKRR